MRDQDRNAVLLWLLWHHQGGSSDIGQPIRLMLGMGRHAHLTDAQVAEAKRIDAAIQSQQDGAQGGDAVEFTDDAIAAYFVAWTDDADPGEVDDLDRRYLRAAAARLSRPAIAPQGEECWTCGRAKHEGSCTDPKWATAAMCDKLLARAVAAEKVAPQATPAAVVQELIAACVEYFGPMDDPSIGWVGHSPSSPELFECERCHEEHRDCALIPHTPHCRAVRMLAALTAALAAPPAEVKP